MLRGVGLGGQMRGNAEIGLFEETAWPPTAIPAIDHNRTQIYSERWFGRSLGETTTASNELWTKVMHATSQGRCAGGGGGSCLAPCWCPQMCHRFVE